MTFHTLGDEFDTAALAAQQAAADAEQLAASYGYDVNELKFQWDRRSFGSFCTTPEGSPAERDRYFRAWKVARARAAKAA